MDGNFFPAVTDAMSWTGTDFAKGMAIGCAVTGTALLLATGGYHPILLVQDWWTRRQRGKMQKREQQEREKKFFAESLTDILEDGVAEGKLSREFVQRIYRTNGNAFTIGDLLPRGELPTKEKAAQNLQNGSLDPVPLPDSTDRKTRLLARIKGK